MSAKTIAHMDMDAFFAAVEQKDDPALVGRPVVVGADPQKGKGRGVVSTCSYEARRFGIRSAMPISEAYRLCPEAVFLPPRMGRYGEISRQIFRLLYDFTPDIEPISIDEAFLDLSGTYHFYGTPYRTGQAIKERIKAETGLTASLGIAPVKMVAKIASDLGKPDGLIEVTPDKLLEFLWPLPVDKLWGVGPKTKLALNTLGLKTVGDLAAMPKEELARRLGENGADLHDLAHGIDARAVQASDEVKSVSHEHTFDKDTSDAEELSATLLSLCEKVSRRLRLDGLRGRTVTLKLRFKDFQTITRAVTLGESTNFIDDIHLAIQKLFREAYSAGRKVRLLGVRVSNFKMLYVKDSLFEDAGKERKEQVHKALDCIKDKFGEGAIHRGA